MDPPYRITMDPPLEHRILSSDPPAECTRHRSRNNGMASTSSSGGITSSILRNTTYNNQIPTGRSSRIHHESSFDQASNLLSITFEGSQDLLPSRGMKRHRSMGMMLTLALVGIACVFFQSNILGNNGDGPTMESRETKTRKLTQLPIENQQEQEVVVEGFLDDFDQRRRRAADLPDGTIFDEPAHTRMCRTILPRLDAYDAGSTSFPEAVFTESEYVCRDPDTPYTAVMNMMAAQLLSAASDNLGLNVRYTHRCAKWERFCSGNMTTIQFHLPDPISMQSYEFQTGCMDGAALRGFCQASLNAGTNDPEMILFPNNYLDESAGTCNMQCYFLQVLPWIRTNLRIVATEWLNTVETRALTFWLRNAAEFSHREKDDMEVSVVSLSCANDGCDMSQDTCECKFEPLPNWVYAMHIPRSSTNVAIIVSPTCAKFGEGCSLHAQELYHFFHTLYPRADITYNVITSTSSWYMRMITADHLVCPPGNGCVLPAIARDAYTYVYEKTSPTVQTWLTCIPDDYLGRLSLPVFPPLYAEGDCRHLRARVGSWTSDLSLAPSLQYSSPVDGYLGCADTNFLASAEEPYRAPTTYRWDETIWATCPVTVLSTSELCTVMDRIGLNRILFVGDHTTMTQAISLASILGQGSDISLDLNVVPNFSKTIACAGTAIGSFELTYIRNDRLEETGSTPSPGNPNCGPSNQQYCYTWSQNYGQYSGKQLLIVNTGYHWADDWQGYITNFQNFVGMIDESATAFALRVSNAPIATVCLCKLSSFSNELPSSSLSSPMTSSCSAHPSLATKNATSTTMSLAITENTAPGL